MGRAVAAAVRVSGTAQVRAIHHTVFPGQRRQRRLASGPARLNKRPTAGAALILVSGGIQPRQSCLDGPRRAAIVPPPAAAHNDALGSLPSPPRNFQSSLLYYILIRNHFPCCFYIWPGGGRRNGKCSCFSARNMLGLSAGRSGLWSAARPARSDVTAASDRDVTQKLSQSHECRQHVLSAKRLHIFSRSHGGCFKGKPNRTSSWLALNAQLKFCARKCMTCTLPAGFMGLYALWDSRVYDVC